MSLSHAELAAMAAEPYEPRGILHSEVALIVHICRRLGVCTVVESGRARAQSTVMLAKYLPQAVIHSVEAGAGADVEYGRQRCAAFPNVRLYDGRGEILLPMIAFVEQGPVAVLCDGPKGAAAVGVIEACFQYPQVVAGFIHDMRRLDHGEPSSHRAAAIVRLRGAAFSDNPLLTASSSWMDANILASGGPCGPAHEAEFGSYGPTIGVFLNTSSATSNSK